MTYQKALEYEIFMPPMEGMHTVIVESAPDKCYIDYQPNNPMCGPFAEAYRMREHHIEMVSCRVGDFESGQTPPNGRSQKSHNLIQNMNKRVR